MNTKPFYLVVGRDRRRSNAAPYAKRVTQTQPTIGPGEAFIRLAVVLTDDVFDHPVHTVAVTDDRIVVAVEVDEPLEGDET